MIVFQKDSEGKFQHTGNQLPTETCMQILVDADSKPLKGVYTYPEAIKKVEGAIANGKTGDHYRYEITSASASHLRKAKATAHDPVKAKKTSKAPKKETGKQRRARLKAAGLCTACGTAKAAKGRCECKECADYYREWAKAKAKKAAK